MNKDPHVYKWGILSCGKISSDFAQCLNKHPRAKIVACAARKQQSAITFAKKFNIPNAYGSYDKLICDPNIDIIYIGTIHIHHKENTIKCLNAGKHVVCEKPLGMNYGETKEMIETAQKNNKFLLEALWTRFFPAFREFRKIIDSGIIGDIIQYDGCLGKNLFQQKNDWFSNSKTGGGALLLMGIYSLHYIPILFGCKFPKQIKAIGNIENGVDTTIATTMLFGEKSYAMMHHTLNGATYNNHQIVGTKGRIRVYFHAPTQIELELYDSKDNNDGKPKYVNKTFELPGGFKYPFYFDNSEGLYYEIDGVTDALDKGLIETKEFSWKESLFIAKINDEIRKQVGVTYEADKQYHSKL